MLIGLDPIWWFGSRKWVKQWETELQETPSVAWTQEVHVVNVDAGGVDEGVKRIPLRDLHESFDDDQWSHKPPPECSLEHWCMVKSMESPVVIRIIAGEWMSLAGTSVEDIRALALSLGCCPLVMFLWPFEYEFSMTPYLKALEERFRRRRRHAREDIENAFRLWNEHRITHNSKVWCWGCLKLYNGMGRGFRKCQACGIARYCSKECQQDHWCKHKEVCNRQMGA